jgi:hypothetical protein
MQVEARLDELATMHPRLLWSEIAAAAAVVLAGTGPPDPTSVSIDCRDLPGFEHDSLTLNIDGSRVDRSQMERLRRTYESPRLVELAAIVMTGLALYYGGGHEIVDVALRGSAADYLVDSSRNRLEIAGRSRRGDLESAWQQRLSRLAARNADGFYLSVVEFRTPGGRLAFFA